jgi:prepilin-type N-terminal cleavage/methylation domain-containing protein
MKSEMKKIGGFTVIELIVVLVIIVILASIGVLVYTNVINKSKAEADSHSVVILNQASVAYALTEKIESSDMFEGISTDEARIQKLVDEHYLEQMVQAQQEGASFCWVVDDQQWIVQGGS